MEKDYRKKSKFGVVSALSSGALWGLDTTISGLILMMSPYISINETIFLAPVIAAFLHDFSSAIWMTIFSIIKKDFRHTIALLRSRSGKFVAIAALFGGPIGMMGYLIAISNIGPGYTAAISAMYPAAGAFFSYIFLGVKLSKKGWLGLSMSIVSIIILGYSPDTSNVVNFPLGFIAAIVCVVGWSLESVICAYGMKEDVSPKEALTIRQMTSSVVYLLIVLFIIKGGTFTVEALTSKSMIYMVLTALVGTLSYICYYTGIDTIGPVKATGLNITYSIWAMIFSMIILGGQFSLKLVLCSLLIIFGSVLVSKDN
ncbi:DMT family transporter [Peptostreptococcus russellii]|uniref:DMT family transporter n=1 Tax=Peptostreptococcus russellii TaxID=215200 RepID=UPI00162A45B7|nr:DMT family transporter [Peptostreptococcus russellii]MBC2578397.1 DMT family transporter [Peptostreptococcus russellii]